jgi:hypothetical protein
MWDNLAITGDLDWIAASIADNSCVAVTNGSYMKELYPYLNSAAFVLECPKGRGRFVEKTPNAGSYRGKLLGLMAIHLILRSLNEVFTDLRGLVHIYSDCLGAPNKITKQGQEAAPVLHPHKMQPLQHPQEHHGELQQPYLSSEFFPT